ncbi:YbjN domain-containing protein [Psychrobacter sp. SWN149]|uniref:YbjN domain-containing protein n=1 Tax=Psychrobacter sp. SWN149 TaxID=2792057 RepID=UPI0018CD86D4|nr:YbjN domain-containing protein [Psychrobacter sp. SWN149]MBH0006434.1 hypothetical protein [Psychrobacter sp. SWN149]
MSQRNKLSLWQKIKRFLTASAPQSVVDHNGISTPVHSSSVDATNSEFDNAIKPSTQLPDSHLIRNTPTDSEQSSSHNSEQSQTDLSDLHTDTRRTEAQDHSDTPIVDCLKQYFNNKQWHYTHYRPKAKDRTNDRPQSHHLSLRMRHKQLNFGYLFRVQEQNKLLAIYGILPFLIPESHQSAAMLLITQINYDMLIGNLEMDVNDGEIRYKNAIDVEAVGIDNDIIEHLLQSVVSMTTVAGELFGNLINNQDPAEDMQSLLADLRQQSDARTFFLPTQFVQ